MSYVGHEPCPKCGSRDNLARYSDGSAWCFGCHHWEPPTISGFVTHGNNKLAEEHTSIDRLLPRIYAEAQTTLPPCTEDWLSRYGITGEECIRAGIRWFGEREQTLLPFYDREGTLCCLQAKNHNAQRARKVKYFNYGEKSEQYTIFGRPSRVQTAKEGSNGMAADAGQKIQRREKEGVFRLVLCEDALSSLKVGRVSPSHPLLGTHIARDKLKTLTASYKSLVVWLDSDKWREAREIADAGKLLGLSTRAILTPDDPKCYTTEQIQEILK